MNKEVFDTPEGWRAKYVSESPLVTRFSVLWESLRTSYQNELAQLAFVPIPEEKEVARSFERIISSLNEKKNK